MKFFLTIYICSIISNTCSIPPGYPKIKSDYYTCVKDGLGESYEILFGGQYFSGEVIVSNRLYAKYECQQVLVPKKKPAAPEKPVSLHLQTKPYNILDS
tara:strand:+ start:147 stop:443 length:297 start_codon:yes stop_codon:yes gene_type:complete